MKDLILIIVSILWCIPILISFVISGLRKKLESDRNFYGKEISPKDIELVKVRYKPIDMKVSDFSECNKDGELQYFYKKGKSQDVVYAISKQEYDRYFLESTVESITAYYPEFIFSYQSTNGSMKATIESYKPTIERYYNPKDIEQYKKLILINRPGRFHYHFRFLYPTADEIRDYMEDKLDKQYYDEIENVIAFSVRMNLNYDCLRSIAFELNNGLKFQEAINDLNIIRISQYKNIKIIVEFENQATLSGKIKEWQLYDNTITDMSIYLPDNIRPLSYVGEYIGEFPMNFSNNYIDKDKRMLMFHVTNPEPEYDIAYTHESQDEEKTDEGKKITDILDKLYIGQKIKRIYAVPSDQKDKFRFF